MRRSSVSAPCWMSTTPASIAATVSAVLGSATTSTPAAMSATARSARSHGRCGSVVAMRHARATGASNVSGSMSDAAAAAMIAPAPATTKPRLRRSPRNPAYTAAAAAWSSGSSNRASTTTRAEEVGQDDHDTGGDRRHPELGRGAAPVVRQRQRAHRHGERQPAEQERQEPDPVADAGDVRRGAADALAQQGDAAGRPRPGRPASAGTTAAPRPRRSRRPRG